jgi:hypothetical protein
VLHEQAMGLETAAAGLAIVRFGVISDPHAGRRLSQSPNLSVRQSRSSAANERAAGGCNNTLDSSSSSSTQRQRSDGKASSTDGRAVDELEEDESSKMLKQNGYSRLIYSIHHAERAKMAKDTRRSWQ